MKRILFGAVMCVIVIIIQTGNILSARNDFPYPIIDNVRIVLFSVSITLIILGLVIMLAGIKGVIKNKI